MGLDFNYGDFRWGYIAFHEFRKELFKMQYFDMDIEKYWNGNIDITKDEILEPLFSHSDCDGWLKRIHIKKMLPRLREIYEDWNKNRHDSTYTEILKEFIESCELAVKDRNNLRFC